MSVREYLSGSYYEIQAYRSDPPQDALAFTGSPRKHPYDDGKIILLVEPHGKDESAIYEFKASDVVGAQDLPSPVTEAGESYRIVRLWVRRGAVGIRYEPFEVDSPLRFMSESHVFKEKILGRHRS
ncbi:MAG: hypothetical protein KKA67_13365 [Spirochaetes bacterium]|nr:hypothetical protein [Spirochaetota bacterium]MBU1079599.1 hypothetical protein [Spirochaetota bacterium]